METQLDFLKRAVKLAESNPGLDIHFCADSEQIMESGWTAHQITKIKINPWFEDDERIMVDEDEIKEHFEESFYDSDLEDWQIAFAVDERYAKEVKQAICIYTNA